MHCLRIIELRCFSLESVPHTQWLYILGNIGYIILERLYCHSLCR